MLPRQASVLFAAVLCIAILITGRSVLKTYSTLMKDSSSSVRVVAEISSKKSVQVTNNKKEESQEAPKGEENNETTSYDVSTYYPGNRSKHPWLKQTDLVYNNYRSTVPIVNEEYNLVFFLTAKVASTEFVRFFTRLQNNPAWCMTNIHHPKVHKLKLLSDYSLSEAQEIMTSPKWTKAIFVRHPKERLLSAFLDKAIQYSKRFVSDYCVDYGRWYSYDECVEKHKQFDFFLKEITTTLDQDVHWRTIYSRIDEKWWPYIHFIGNMDNLANDAKTLLSSIHSNKDGVSAWDRIGNYGWSGEKNNQNCTVNLQSDLPFLGHGKDKLHTTGANDKLKRYYTPELEQFVESRYEDDLNNPFFHFHPIVLYLPTENEIEEETEEE